MKKRMLIIAPVLLLVCVGLFAAPIAEKQVALVNTIEISVKNVSLLSFHYVSDSLVFYESDSDLLIVREFMSKDNPAYYAQVEEKNHEIKIRAGGRPNGLFSSRIEIYLPAWFQKNISAVTSSGSIKMVDSSHEFSQVSFKASSGSITSHNIIADTITINTSSGSITCESLSAPMITLTASSGSVKGEYLRGKLVAEAKSGSIVLDRIHGSGSFETSSGSIRLSFDSVENDITARASSGSITMELPSSRGYAYSATSSSGSVSSDLGGHSVRSDKTITGQYGTHPYANISVSASSGSVRLKIN